MNILANPIVLYLLCALAVSVAGAVSWYVFSRGRTGRFVSREEYMAQKANRLIEQIPSSSRGMAEIKAELAKLLKQKGGKR